MDSDPSHIEPESIRDRSGPTHLTESQAKALSELVAIGRLIGHRETYGGFRARIKPLLFGPSGAGKTALCSRLADTLGQNGQSLPLLSVDCGGWIVHGARAEPTTLLIVRSFVRRNPTGGIILVDEIDKAVPSGPETWTHHWSLSVLTELLALLDATDGNTRIFTAGWTREDVDRLARHFMVIGAGAWQRQQRKAAQTNSSHATALMEDLGIPEELAFRFNTRFIEIGPPTAKDLRQAFTRVHRDLDLKLAGKDLDKLVESAIESRCGMRAVEQYVTDLLAANPNLRRKPEPEPAVESKPGKTIVSRSHIFSETTNLHRLMEAAEIPVMALKMNIWRIGPGIWPTEDGPLSLTSDLITARRFGPLCDDLLHGLNYRYAVDDKDIDCRTSEIWNAGNKILHVLREALRDRSNFEGCEHLVPLFANASIRINRVLVAMKYLSTLEAAKDEV